MTRERIEWSNYWWENANDNCTERILLIGDSISVGYRTYVQEKLLGSYCVDLLSTSKSIEDKSFFKELNYFLNEYDYKYIHFNNGLHGLDISEEVYTCKYEEAIKLMLEKCPNLILVTSTQISDVTNSNLLDKKLNPVVIMKNEVVKKLAQKYKLRLNDMYSPVVEHSEFRIQDGFHYNEIGKQFQADLIVNMILNK